MITRNKLALEDFADFALDIANTVLANLLSAGISSGLSAFMTPAAARPATGPGGLAVGGGVTSQLHAGGVVGRDGVPRLVDPAVFAGARRLHGGGPVLGPGEVPIIALRGETVVPRGAQAGGGTTVIIEDRRGASAPAIEQRRERGGAGEDIRRFVIREVSQAWVKGDFDRAAQTRHGLTPTTARR
jgi:hypothetical protein